MKPEDYKPDLDRVVEAARKLEQDADPTPLERLKRRKIVQWGLGYLAAAWLALQVLDFLRENFGWSPVVIQSVTVLLAVGFLATLVVAWYHGEKGRQRLGAVEAVILLVLVAVAGFGVTRVLQRVDGEAAARGALSDAADPIATRVDRGADPSRTLAVMPFEILSASETDASLAEGLTIEIGNGLSQVADLRVISRSAVRAAFARSGDVFDAAREVRADRILEGTVRVGSDDARVSVTVSDVETQEQVWTEAFTRPLEDLRGLESSAAIAIVDALSASLTPDERARISASGTEDLAARRLYERTRSLFGTLPDQNALARQLLEEAIELDPTYVAAYARLSWYHTWVARSGDLTQIDTALALAETAVRLGPQSAQAQYALASVAGVSPRGGVVREYRRALELDPSSDTILSDLSWLLSATGDLDEAVDYAVRAVTTAPNESNRWAHLWITLAPLDMDEQIEAVLDHAETLPLEGPGASPSRIAAARAQQALARGSLGSASEIALAALNEWGGRPEVDLWAAETLLLAGETEVAWTIFEPLLATSPTRSSIWYLRPVAVSGAYLLLARGETERAAEVLDDIEQVQTRYLEAGWEIHTAAMSLAAVHAMRGDRDAALRMLREAYDHGFRWQRVLAIDPVFEALRGDEEFERLIEQMATDVARAVDRIESDGLVDEIDRLIADEQ